MKQDAAISVPKEVDLTIRPPVAVSCGPILEGAAMPHPDPHDPLTMVAGVIKRFATRPPEPDVQLLAELEDFVDKWLKEHMVPLAPETDLSVEAWLAKTNYPEWRKQELRDKWERVGSIREKRYWAVKSFMKDETYPAYKHARGINSRTDEFKVAVGPMFKAIEEKLYQDPSFIKHVPVSERPKYIRELLYREGVFYLQTDYESFEALFVRAVMQALEFRLYRYMTSKIPGGPEFMSLVEEVLGGLNWCEYRDFFVQLMATRMSGEMCTSLGNGWANKMLMLFVLWRWHCRDVAAVVEGDDGLAVARGNPPDGKVFELLGMKIKLERVPNLAEASFCGMVFDPEDCLVVADPREAIASFGWASGRYSQSGPKTLRTLLRCKALSLLHQYPGCPVIAALGRYGLRVTRDVKRIHMYRLLNSRKAFSGWERDQLLAALKDERNVHWVDPPPNTRLLVERLYGIPVETQLYIERLLDAKDDLRPIKDPVLLSMCPTEWAHYWSHYVGSATDPRRPVLSVPRKKVFLPCVRRGDWLVPPDYRGKLRPVKGRLMNLSTRADTL